jgi:hypothetical protein
VTDRAARESLRQSRAKLREKLIHEIAKAEYASGAIEATLTMLPLVDVRGSRLFLRADQLERWKWAAIAASANAYSMVTAIETADAAMLRALAARAGAIGREIDELLGAAHATCARGPDPATSAARGWPRAG